MPGWALLLLSWAGGQPPGAAPDEAVHLVKALGTATGQGLGTVPDMPLPEGNAFLSAFVRQYDLPDG